MATLAGSDITAKAKAPRRRRGGGPKALARPLAQVTKAAFGRRGFPGGAIINDWELIAGAELARHSRPEKVVPAGGGKSGGTLHLRIDSGAMATELQHLEPLLIERINGHFGYRAVSRLSIVQGPLPAHPGDAPRRVETPLPAAEEADLARSLADVDDPALRQALEALGRAIRRGRP